MDTDIEPLIQLLSFFVVTASVMAAVESIQNIYRYKHYRYKLAARMVASIRVSWIGMFACIYNQNTLAAIAIGILICVVIAMYIYYRTYKMFSYKESKLWLKSSSVKGT